MQVDPDELMTFPVAAERLAERLGITQRELCGYVLDDRLISYTGNGERIFTIQMMGEWALIAAREKSAPDYLPTVEARCHFLKKDIEAFDPAYPFPEVIEEYRQKYGIEVVAEDGSVSLDISDISVPTHRCVEGQWLLDRLQGRVSDPVHYLRERIEKREFEYASYPVYDRQDRLAIWLFDRDSAERVLSRAGINDDSSEFIPLTTALAPWFRFPLADIPPALQTRIREAQFLEPWDKATPDLRQQMALNWDLANDPKIQIKRDRRGAWADEFVRREVEIEGQIKLWETRDTPTATDLEIQRKNLAELYRQRDDLSGEFRRWMDGDDLSPSRGHLPLDENVQLASEKLPDDFPPEILEKLNEATERKNGGNTPIKEYRKEQCRCMLLVIWEEHKGFSDIPITKKASIIEKWKNCDATWTDSGGELVWEILSRNSLIAIKNKENFNRGVVG